MTVPANVTFYQAGGKAMNSATMVAPTLAIAK